MKLVELIESTRGLTWEVVVAMVGGYLAAKKLPNLGRTEFLTYMGVAVVVAFTAVNVCLPYSVKVEWIDHTTADNLRPFALLSVAAAALKVVDLSETWIVAIFGLLKGIKIKIGKEQ